MLSDKRGTPRICNYEYTIMSGKFRMRGGKYGIHFFKETAYTCRDPQSVSHRCCNSGIERQKEIRKSVMSLQANLINFLQSSVHVLPTTKMLFVIIFFVCVKCRIKLQTKF